MAVFGQFVLCFTNFGGYFAFSLKPRFGIGYFYRRDVDVFFLDNYAFLSVPFYFGIASFCGSSLVGDFIVKGGFGG